MKRGALVWFVAMLILLPWECIAQIAESVAREPGPNPSSFLSPRFSRDSPAAWAQLGASPDRLLKAQLAPTQNVPSAQTGRRKFRTSWPMVISGGVLMFFGALLTAASTETIDVSLSDPFTGKPFIELRKDRNNGMLGAGIGMLGGGGVLLVVGLTR